MTYRMTDLKNFVEASSCSTIIQAARKLEISQPALSESVKRLEADARSKLFYRSRAGIQLTPSGRAFLLKAQKVLAAFTDLDLESGHHIFGSRTISIGCHPTVAQYTVPSALDFLKTSASDYRIELKHDLSRNIQAEVQRGNIDIGIVVNPVRLPDLVVQRLAFDTVYVWRSKEAEITKPDTIICNQHLFQSQSILRKWKNQPQRVISTDSLELICRLTYKNVGYGIIPEKAVSLSGLKLEKKASLPSYKDEISLVFRPEFGRTKPEKLVIEALKKSLTAY